MTLTEYCKGFDQASKPEIFLSASQSAEIKWWHEFKKHLVSGDVIENLLDALPQLRFPQRFGISQSDAYRSVVLCGKPFDSKAAGGTLQWQDPKSIQFDIADHFCGAVPVLYTTNHADFTALVRALAYRCEPVNIAEGVHAQAIGGLIHWGLVRALGSKYRAQIILLHDAPYGSVPASQVPGSLSPEEWLAQSYALRLEHELTHLATKKLFGQMRLNLLDELIADAMGMIHARGKFSSDLFRRCLGVSDNGNIATDARVWTYVTELNNEDAKHAIKLTLDRARELEQLHLNGCLPSDPVTRLRWFCVQRLDRTWL